jgi:1-deoxy-D-xylulose-5-phosphate synthase
MDLPIYIFETDCKIGSLSSAIAEYYQQRFSNSTVLGVGDHYIEQSPIRTLRIRERVSLNALFKEINDDGKDSIR